MKNKKLLLLGIAALAVIYIASVALFHIIRTSPVDLESEELYARIHKVSTKKPDAHNTIDTTSEALVCERFRGNNGDDDDLIQVYKGTPFFTKIMRSEAMIVCPEGKDDKECAALKKTQKTGMLVYFRTNEGEEEKKYYASAAQLPFNEMERIELQLREDKLYEFCASDHTRLELQRSNPGFANYLYFYPKSIRELKVESDKN